MIRKVYGVLKTQGAAGLFDIIFRHFIPRYLDCHQFCRPFFHGKIGLEIGGPSANFKRSGFLPVYTLADRIDNCNFCNSTTWEGSITEGITFHYDKRHEPGYQYISEATNLCGINSASYDFVLSSHTLEHTANPLLALSEWIRVLKDQGLLVLVVPDRNGTFDHRRPVTSLAHLITDFEQQVTEGDLTHLVEIIRLHDLAMDPGANDFESFKQRSERNLENRCLHHHVFDTHLAVEVINYIGLQIIAVETCRPYHIVVVAQKPVSGQKIQNERFLTMGTTPS